MISPVLFREQKNQTHSSWAPVQGSTDILPAFLRGISDSMDKFGSSNTFAIFLAKKTECELSQEEDSLLSSWVELYLERGPFSLEG